MDQLDSATEQEDAYRPAEVEQEVRTRFDFCYEMVDRYLPISPSVTWALLEMQREGSSKAKVLAIITPEEERELTEVRDLLEPLSCFTKEQSYEKVTTLSKCIPMVATLRLREEEYKPRTEIGKSMKKTMKALINQKFGMIENVPLFAKATVDPRFKTYSFFEDDSTPRRVANAVTAVGNLVKDRMRVAQQQQQETSAACNQPAGTSRERSFWGPLDERLKERSSMLVGQDVAGGMPVELLQYLNSALVPRATTPNPLVAWETLKGEYKVLYPLAQEYLGILAPSLPMLVKFRTTCELALAANIWICWYSFGHVIGLSGFLMTRETFTAIKRQYRTQNDCQHGILYLPD